MIASASIAATVESVNESSPVEDEILVGIGEAARIVGVASHTVRYWEKEFSFFLKPPRTIGRQRRYDEENLERLMVIRRMLKDEGYSIAGAKRNLLRNSSEELPKIKKESLQENDVASRIVRLIREEILEQVSASAH